MEDPMQLNHIANRLAEQHFETVVALFTECLGFRVLRRTDRSIWLRQPGATVDLQFSRSATTTRDADKLRSQVSFLSENPQAELDNLATWLDLRGVAAKIAAYSDREFYLDAPEAFIDFVLEAMLPELADYGVQN